MKKQKEKRCSIWGRLCLLVALLLVEAALFQHTSLDAYAQGKATVIAGSGKIRESASTNSEVVASVQSGDELDVIAQTTDSNGYTWYKVYVNGDDTGYIRADLVGDVTGTISTENDSDTTENSNSEENADDTEEESSAQQVLFVQVNDTTATSGKVIGASVNVRENPSTSAAVSGKAKGNTEVTISGEATDTEGKIWYQVSFENVTGFIRSDFLEVTQTEEASESIEETVEEIVEETVEEPVVEVEEEPVEEYVNQDYEVIYEVNAEGVEEWFLYDYTRGTKQSVENLLTAVRQNQEDEQSAVSQLKTFKILAIVMVAVILALIIVVTVLIFKLRDAYEYEYEEDDEDEEDDDDDYEAVGRQTTAVASHVIAAATSGERKEPVRRESERNEPVQREASSMSKNFLDIDDDMDFEFLDLK